MITRGPWRYELAPLYVNAQVKGYRGAHVATVWSNSRTMAEVEHNARTIAAAPELREALSHALAALTEEGCTEKQRALAIRLSKRALLKTSCKRQESFKRQNSV